MEKDPCYILGIESSCDDTAAAVLCNDEVLSSCIANQEIHRQYGGVVPELASRAHQANIIPVVHQALSIANIDKKQLCNCLHTRTWFIGFITCRERICQVSRIKFENPINSSKSHAGAFIMSFYKE